MLSPLASIDLRTILTARAALVPVTGGVMAGFAIALFRGSIGRLLLFGKEQESLMNFSNLGTLRCICGEKHPKGIGVDRRQFCRSCGCEIVATNTALLDKHLTRKEIKAMTSSLSLAALRASHLELPPTITTIEELHEYLESPLPKVPRTVSTRPTEIQHHQVH
jgi:hypothetical protein